MRKFLAILLCKLGHLVGRLFGKGSSMPGKLALRICPDILARVKLPPKVVAVTGSNGKTSTVEMITAVLEAKGLRVVCNREGSNQIEGVTTTILTHAGMGGRVRGDVLVLESDERYAVKTFAFFHPTITVVTNLYRDQLTRNGHPEWVFDALQPAIFSDGMLLLNADDPLSSCLGKKHWRVKRFGLNECSISTQEPSGVYHDGVYCPLCKSRLEYDYYHYNHIGAFRCTTCEHAKHATQYTGTELDLDQGVLTINDSAVIHLAFRSIYNVYNILAAYAVCAECGVEEDIITGVINNYILKNGRMVHFRLGEHPGTLLISKHENSIAYDTNLRYVADTHSPCAVMVIVDAISRKYFTSETSWLWDIDFDQLNRSHVEKVLLCGQYAGDLAVRLAFTGIPAARVEVHPDVQEACLSLRADGSLPLYAVTCFSDKEKLLKNVAADGEPEKEEG